MRDRRLLAVFVFAPLALAACGGSAAKLYDGPATLAAAQATLAQVDVHGADAVSAQAPVSFAYQLSDGSSGVIAVWRTSSDAAQLGDTIKQANPQFGDRFEQHGNVSVVWDQAPSSSDRGAVEAILR